MTSAIKPLTMTRYFLGTDGHVLVERRATPRYEVELDIEINLVASQRPLRGKTRDISEAGMQIVLPGPIRQGRVVDFACPAFAGTAQTVWCREEESQVRLGLRFVSLSPEDQQVLTDIVSRLRKAAAAGAMAGLE